jgi:hypothetical protein
VADLSQGFPDGKQPENAGGRVGRTPTPESSASDCFKRRAMVTGIDEGKEGLMPRYSRKAGQKVKRAMHEMKRGELRSGRSGKKVKSRKQAIAIGLSEARRAGAKVPTKR